MKSYRCEDYIVDDDQEEALFFTGKLTWGGERESWPDTANSAASR